MNGFVSNLYDIDSIVIPEEMLNISVDEQRVEDEVGTLALRYAKEEFVDQAEKGDLVYCQADKETYPDGRTILVYTGVAMPGAEKAAEAVLGSKAGDTVKTEIAGKALELTIEKILRRTPVEVTDELVAGIGIEGVTTLDEYRKHVSDKIKEDIMLENEKAIVRYYLDQMTENSTYVYDEKEMEDYIKTMTERYMKEAETMGEPEDMDDFLDPEYMKESITAQAKQGWMAEAFCKSKDIEIDRAAIEEDADKTIEMMELMGEEVPDRSEIVEMTLNNAYFDGLFAYINKLIEEKRK